MEVVAVKAPGSFSEIFVEPGQELNYRQFGKIIQKLKDRAQHIPEAKYAHNRRMISFFESCQESLVGRGDFSRTTLKVSQAMYKYLILLRDYSPGRSKRIGKGWSSEVYAIEMVEDGCPDHKKRLAGKLYNEEICDIENIRKHEVRAGLCLHDVAKVTPSFGLCSFPIDGEEKEVMVMPCARADALSVARKWDPNLCRRYMYDVTRGVASLQAKGLVQCDFKASNVLVFPREEGKVEFRLADMDSIREMPCFNTYGNYAHRHPQIFDDEEKVETVLPHHMNYSLAVELYWCFTGDFPYPVITDESAHPVPGGNPDFSKAPPPIPDDAWASALDPSGELRKLIMAVLAPPHRSLFRDPQEFYCRVLEILRGPLPRGEAPLKRQRT